MMGHPYQQRQQQKKKKLTVNTVRMLRTLIFKVSVVDNYLCTQLYEI
jgi:hypothetical protein